MELRVLKYFLMVAREENITKAAQLLHVTQPTLSRQLMQLEEELGVQLFHRGKHNVTLTEDGMLLRRRAQELVSLSEKTKMELQHKEEMPTGEIAIGCGETKSMAALSEKMVSFRQKYPLVQFSIYSAIADDIKERLEKKGCWIWGCWWSLWIFQVRIYPSAAKRTVGRIGASRFAAGGERICHAGGFAWRSAAHGAPRAGKKRTGQLVW